MCDRRNCDFPRFDIVPDVMFDALTLKRTAEQHLKYELEACEYITAVSDRKGMRIITKEKIESRLDHDSCWVLTLMPESPTKNGNWMKPHTRTRASCTHIHLLHTEQQILVFHCSYALFPVLWLSVHFDCVLAAFPCDAARRAANSQTEWTVVTGHSMCSNAFIWNAYRFSFFYHQISLPLEVFVYIRVMRIGFFFEKRGKSSFSLFSLFFFTGYDTSFQLRNRLHPFNKLKRSCWIFVPFHWSFILCRQSTMEPDHSIVYSRAHRRGHSLCFLLPLCLCHLPVRAYFDIRRGSPINTHNNVVNNVVVHFQAALLGRAHVHAPDASGRA